MTDANQTRRSDDGRGRDRSPGYAVPAGDGRPLRGRKKTQATHGPFCAFCHHAHAAPWLCPHAACEERDEEEEARPIG
jgi:hypothetical protein